MDNPIDKIYSDLRHHYQLIFLYDLEGYRENDLTSLLMRLEGEMGLDPREKQIHEELIRKSEANVAKVLEQKARQRREKGMKKASHLAALLVQHKVEEQESQYIEQNCMIGGYLYHEEEVEYKETQRFSGNFINGRMTILLPIGLDNEREPLQKATFEIIPEQKCSQITRATLRQCNLRSDCESAALSVGCRPSEFRITNGEINILGMSYLRSNNVITRGNYRSEQSKFTMIFTE